MRLLFDNNLSKKLPSLLNNIFPDSIHVADIDKEHDSDINIWNYAKENDFTIVSKDWDFYYLNSSFGSPPKLILIIRGNCTFDDIVELLNQNEKEISNFLIDDKDLLILK